MLKLLLLRAILINKKRNIGLCQSNNDNVNLITIQIYVSYTQAFLKLCVHDSRSEISIKEVFSANKIFYKNCKLVTCFWTRKLRNNKNIYVRFLIRRC